MTILQSTALPILRNNRNFKLIWGGLFLSQIGDIIRFIALPAVVYKTTGSSLSVAGIMIAGAVPSLFFAPISGFLIDRFSRQKLLIISCLVRGLCSALLPMVVDQLHLLYLVTLLSAAMSQFYMPVISALMPGIVQREDLMRANALTGFSYRTSQILGGALAGFLLISLGSTWAFWLDALSFWLFASVVIFLRLPHNPPAQNPTENIIHSFIHEHAEAIRFLRQSPLVLFVILVFIVDTISGASLSTLMPAYTFQYLGSSEAGLGLLFSMRALGALIGMGILALFGHRLGTTTLMVYTLAAAGVTLLLLGTTHTFIVAATLLLFEGLLGSGYTVSARTLQQERVDHRMLGKVIALSMAFSSISYSIAAGVAGLLANQVAVPVIFIIDGVVLFIFPLIFIFVHKRTTDV